MDTKLLLTKCIMLLYWESRVTNPVDNSAALVKSILGTIKVGENSFGGDNTNEVINSLRSTVAWMVDQHYTHTYDKGVLLQRIELNVSGDTALLNAVSSGFEGSEDPKDIANICGEHRNELFTHLEREEIKKILTKFQSKIAFEERSIDWGTFIPQLKAELEPYNGVKVHATDPSIVDSVDFGDLNSIADAVRRGLEESGTEGIMPTRWQGLNRMMGEYGGIRRGDFIVVGALQHNYKTGFTLNLFRQISCFTQPYMRDPTKKPMMLHISTEDSVKDNILRLYVRMKALETGERLDVTALAELVKEDPALLTDIASYVKANMEATGYTVKMLRVDPSTFTYQKLFNLINKYESQGYEIHLLVIDYLNMMSKEGCTCTTVGSDVRDLFRRVRNYCNPRGITVITPHQISSEAKNLIRNGTDSFVKAIANKGYWDSCRVLDQEVDLELYIHIEKIDGESYLTIQRGKHRKVGITPEQDLYTVYKFHAVLDIPEDADGADLSRRRVAGDTMARGGQPAFFDFG